MRFQIQTNGCVNSIWTDFSRCIKFGGWRRLLGLVNNYNSDTSLRKCPISSACIELGQFCTPGITHLYFCGRIYDFNFICLMLSVLCVCSCEISIVRCWDLDCPQGAGTETSRINDETPTSYHEHIMGRQDNQHRSAGSSWSTINGDHPNHEPEVARSCWENGSPASPQAATLLTVMRGQIQSEYTKAEIQRHCKKKPEEVGYRKEFVAADGQRRTELRRGILNETVIVASDRLLWFFFNLPYATYA